MESKLKLKYIIQHLNNNGLSNVAHKLELESGIYFESEEIKKIKNLILEDNIDEAILIMSNEIYKNYNSLENGNTIEFNNNSDEKIKNSLTLILIKNKLILYKIFQLIINNDIENSLKLIRENIEQLQNIINKNISTIQEEIEKNKECLHLIFLKNRNQLNNKIEEICKYSSSKENLIKYINQIIINQKDNLTLEQILDKTIQKEIKVCKYHNITENNYSYFFNHKCEVELIPYKRGATIEMYNEEILNLIYSNSFEYFAVILKENNIAIYKINKNEKDIEISLINTIVYAHKSTITSLQWNNLNNLILTASKDKLIKIFEPFSGKLTLQIDGHLEMVSSAIFVLNDTKILSSGLDYKITLWSLEGNPEFSLNVSNVTISELHYSVKLNLVIVISATTNSIIFYNIFTKKEIDKLPFNDAIVSCALSKLDQGTFLLVNSSKATPVLNLINLNHYTKIIRKFFGHRQERFNNKCNFGGINENFVLCGSEDAKIFIWNRNHSVPIYSIKLHSGPVNSVIWANTYELKDVIISCSDDHTIKIMTNDNIEKVNINYRMAHRTENMLSARLNLINTQISNNINITSVSTMLTRIGNFFGSQNYMIERNDEEEDL